MSKVPLILAIVALIVAIVAFGLAVAIWADGDWFHDRDTDWASAEARADRDHAVWLERENRPAQGRVYNFGYENWEKPSNFLTPSGRLAGISVEFAQAVCHEQGKQCVHMYVADPTQCWNGETQIGTGIAEGLLDGCVDWTQTLPRQNVFDFTSALFASNANSDARLYMLNGRGYTQIGSRKVVFGLGAYQDPGCLARNGKPLTKQQVVYAGSAAEMFAKLRSGEVDFMFIEEYRLTNRTAVTMLPNSRVQCYLGGAAVMTRKGSDVIPWFNEGVRKIRDNGRYREICGAAEDNYGVASKFCLD